MSAFGGGFVTKHIVCYSGGHSSALVAIEVVRKFGANAVVLLNHNINPRVEDADIKRFKGDVAAYLDLQITYANMVGWDALDQFDVCVKASAFKVNNGQELCTNRLKTEPFMSWLAANVTGKDCVIYYGFDANEQHRIQRRSGILGAQGYATDYPLALWGERTIQSTLEVGIARPNTYGVFKHGNCIGCLKAGLQHWYIVYCTRPDIWGKAKWAEEEIGYSIHADGYLEEYEDLFERMKRSGVPATEHIQPQSFWASAKRLAAHDRAGQLSMFTHAADARPCECFF